MRTRTRIAVVGAVAVVPIGVGLSLILAFDARPAVALTTVAMVAVCTGLVWWATDRLERLARSTFRAGLPSWGVDRLVRSMFPPTVLTDPVRGEAYVVATSTYPAGAGATYANCSMTLVVQAPGVPPTSVPHRCLAPTSRWPAAGSTLPVSVDRADPHRLQVLWDEVQTWDDKAQAEGERLAEEMRTGGPAAAPPGGTRTVVVNGEVVDASRYPGLSEDLAGLIATGVGDPGFADRLTETLHAHGVGTGAGQAGDPAERLRCLEKLRQQGLIDAAEYAAQRRRILDQL